MKKYVIPILALTQTLFADFSFDLADTLGRSDENWVFSPFSISSCLSMVKAGARGDTADEMSALLNLAGDFEASLSTLKHSPTASTDFELSIAQGVWVKDLFPILPSFRALLEQTYSAAIEPVQFVPATADRINGWISQQTHDKIQNLLSPSLFSDLTRMVLVNALYFHGSWVRPFSAKNTATDYFRSPSAPIATPFMEQTETFPYFENKECKAVLLPFSTRSNQCEPICMLLLPHEENGELKLTAELFEEALHASQSAKVRIRVPKFEITKQFDLKTPLQQMGMQTVFSYQADLSGIDGALDLYLSDILHKSFFSFDENGVEAAAATAAIINLKTSIDRPFPILHRFIADHPFYFILFDKKSETILFIGYIQKP